MPFALLSRVTFCPAVCWSEPGLFTDTTIPLGEANCLSFLTLENVHMLLAGVSNYFGCFLCSSTDGLTDSLPPDTKRLLSSWRLSGQLGDLQYQISPGEQKPRSSALPCSLQLQLCASLVVAISYSGAPHFLDLSCFSVRVVKCSPYNFFFKFEN